MSFENDYLASNIDRSHADLEDAFFSHLQEIQRRRALRWASTHYESQVRILAEVCEKLFAEWLRPQIHPEEAEQIVLIALPFLSYRLLNFQRSKSVRLLPISTQHRKQFLDVYVEQLGELPHKRLFRLISEDHLKLFLVFLEGLLHKRDQ